MTRVLFLAQRVPPPECARSGAGARAALLLEALRLHFDVLPLFAEPAGSESRPLPSWRRYVPGRLRGLRQDLRFLHDDREALRSAAAAAERFRPDVVYERNEYLSQVGTRLARRLGVPLVLDVNGVLELDMRSFYRSLGEPLGRRIERVKLRRADAIATTSQTLARALVARGAHGDRVYLVPNSVSGERLRHSGRDAAGEGGPTVVGWLGHGLAWHGLDLLAQAAERIAAIEPGVVYRIVGEGPAVDRLKEQVAAGSAARYEFVGGIPLDELGPTLAAFDVGVVPDNPEDRFPIKLVEMGAAGVAVAAPPVSCITDLLRPGVDFETFRPREPEDLARVLRLLVANRDRRRALGYSLQARVRQEFSVEATGGRLREIVERVVAARV